MVEGRVVEGTDRFCDVGDGVTLCYRVLGEPDGEPIVLIAGLSLDLTSWPDGFVRGLTEAGLRVVVLDGRDIGRSTRQPGPMPPRRRWLLGRPTPGGFDLRDLAADLVVLLDRLGIARAHVLGTSLGGMIGQVLAATRPDKVATFVSMYSNTGARGIGQPDPSSRRLLAHRRPRTAEEYAGQYLAMIRHIGSATYPIDEAVETAWAKGLWERADGQVTGGVVRQVNAMLRTGDRTALLRRITAPTLVIHGERDLMVDPSGGAATAAAIPAARLVTIEGMRHHIAPGLTPQLVGLIVDHVRAHPAGGAVLPVGAPSAAAAGAAAAAAEAAGGIPAGVEGSVR